MGKFSFDGYRTQWPRVGGVLAMAIGGAAALGARKMSKPQLLSALNFGALLVHQYEEHVDPGWVPGQFNGGVFKSDQPRNYPLSKSTALCVNTAFAYPYYILPILFPRKKPARPEPGDRDHAVRHAWGDRAQDCWRQV